MNAQSAQAHLPGFSDLLLTFVSLAAIVVIILGLGWLAKRFNIAGGRNSQIPLKYVGQISVGNKEKVSVIDVGNERLVLGVTAHQITLLSKQPQLQFQTPPVRQKSVQTEDTKQSEHADKVHRKERHTPVFSEILEETKEESEDGRL